MTEMSKLPQLNEAVSSEIEEGPLGYQLEERRAPSELNASFATCTDLSHYQPEILALNQPFMASLASPF